MLSPAINHANYNIKLDFFSGPMDLLLHLVHQREVSIAEVNLSEICEQYLEIISRASFLDLDKATEYLVIAATLIAMKSQSLLPGSDNVDERPEEAFDPRFFEDLRAKLQAYETTKKRALSLCSAVQLGVNTFARGVKGEFAQVPELHFEPEASTIGSAFLSLLKRIGEAADTFRIRMEPVSVVSFMMKLVDRLTSRIERARSSGSLFDLAAGIWKSDYSRSAGSKKSVLIGSLIAVLELARRGVVSVSQEDGGREITVAFGSVQEGGLELSSEFDSGADSKVVRLDDYRVNEGSKDVRELREANRA